MKFHRPAIIFAAIFGASAGPASADISALYEAGTYEDEIDRAVDFAITIEVSDEGHARLHLSGRSSYFLIRHGEIYTVTRGIDGPYAEKLDDLEAVIANAGQAGGISLEILDQLPKIDLVRSGTVKVGKWKGQGYARRDYDDEIGRAELVLTGDESLRPIGTTLAKLAVNTRNKDTGKAVDTRISAGLRKSSRRLRRAMVRMSLSDRPHPPSRRAATIAAIESWSSFFGVIASEVIASKVIFKAAYKVEPTRALSLSTAPSATQS